MNQKLLYFVLMSFSLLITQQVNALQNTIKSEPKNVNIDRNLISAKCPETLQGKDGYTVYSRLDTPQPFYEVDTLGDSLRIRQTPNGKIIGAVPNRWQVYVAKFDSTGRWAYIRHINSPYYDTFYGFGSAPGFRSDGWVSSDYLVYLGEYCAKPNLLSLLPSDSSISIKNNDLSDTVWHSLENEILAKFNN